MSAYLATGPVSVAVYTALNVAAMTALASGGIHEDVPPHTSFPFVLYEVNEERDLSGLGTIPGDDRVTELQLRLHVFSQYPGFLEADAILAKAIELLKNPLTVTGYACPAVFHDLPAVKFQDELVAGQKCKEVVKDIRIVVENA